MNDELDGLPDDKLSEVFAVEVAGWVRCEASPWVTQMGYSETWYRPVAPDGAQFAGIPPSFATDANAVLPWLETSGRCFSMSYDQSLHSDYTVGVYDPTTDENISGFAPTFARAACLALIRAKRIARGKAKS